MAKAKLYKFIRRIISFLAFSIALGYLIYLLRNKLIDFNLGGLFTLARANLGVLLLVFLLMFVNWGVELLKWKYFTTRFQSISLWNSVKSILLGIVVGMLTPNRIGELGGRLIYIDKENRNQAIYVNTLCSVSQTMATLVFGLLALYGLASEFNASLNISIVLLKVIVLCLLIIASLIYLRGNVLRTIIDFLNQKLNSNKKDEIKRFSLKDRLILLAVSSLRYLVFCVQFVLLISIFLRVNQSFQIALGVSLIFLCTTLIPSGWISDIAIRTSFSYFILDALGYDGQFGVVASLLLWGINLFIPALIGLPMLIKLSWFSKTAK